jgi:hypothetical protein
MAYGDRSRSMRNFLTILAMVKEVSRKEKITR